VRQISREQGRALRIAGWILLVLGLVLCLSVVWAPLGLLMLGVGLILLQVAEQKRRKARTAAAPANAGADKPMEVSAIPRPKEPRVFREPAPIQVAPGGAPEVARHGYDKEEWRRLVESDPDLAQLASVLGDYGQQYVDAFARNYLEAPNKNRIAGIVDGIVASARSSHSARTTAPSERDRPPAAPAREPKVARPRRDSGDARLAPPAPTAATEPTAETETLPAVETASPPPAAPAASAPAETAAVSSDIAAAPPLELPPEEVTVEPPKIEPAKPDQPRDSAAVTSSDVDLAEMIRKFAPDSSFLRKT
jgi:hypothetical protein